MFVSSRRQVLLVVSAQMAWMKSWPGDPTWQMAGPSCVGGLGAPVPAEGTKYMPFSQGSSSPQWWVMWEAGEIWNLSGLFPSGSEPLDADCSQHAQAAQARPGSHLWHRLLREHSLSVEPTSAQHSVLHLPMRSALELGGVSGFCRASNGIQGVLPALCAPAAQQEPGYPGKYKRCPSTPG